MTSHLQETLDSKRWAEKIRALRTERGWSQRDLADRLGVHPQAVSEVERGRAHFTLERLNRILEALGYEGTIQLEPLRVETRADWGPVDPSDPGLRRRIRTARRLAEELAEQLYSQFDVEAVFCFGSLAEDGGANFREKSDVDLLVEGLDAPKLFEAESTLEIEVIESSTEYEGIGFDLVRTEDIDADPEQLVDDNRAVFLPRS